MVDILLWGIVGLGLVFAWRVMEVVRSIVDAKTTLLTPPGGRNKDLESVVVYDVSRNLSEFDKNQKLMLVKMDELIQAVKDGPERRLQD